MKILVAYDGSTRADAAVVDMRRTGIPKDAEVLVISVVDASGSSSPDSEFSASPVSKASKLDLREGQALVDTVHKWIQSNFPEWKATRQVLVGSPATVILEKSRMWHPDLIIVGSHGRSLAGRVLLGSISQKLTQEAPCSVRVVRAAISASRSDSHEPIRILVGSDGSAEADAVVRSVSERVWPEKTEVRIVSVLEESDEQRRSQLIETAKKYIERLQRTGLIVTSVLIEGDPKRELVGEADRWKANAIFVGARGLGRLEQILLGSVSNSVLNHAHCAVEIVRGK